VYLARHTDDEVTRARDLPGYSERTAGGIDGRRSCDDDHGSIDSEPIEAHNCLRPPELTHPAELGAEWPLYGLLDHWLLRRLARKRLYSTHEECTNALCFVICCSSFLLCHMLAWALDLRTTVACAERKLADARALTLAARRGAWLANDAASERAATAFTRVTAAERKLRVAERAVAEAEDAATEERGLTALVTADAIAAEQRATTERTAGRAAANAWCAAEAELEEERIRMCDAQTRHRAEVARLTAERDVATKRAAAAERATVAVGGGTAGGGPRRGVRGRAHHHRGAHGRRR
jgi:hypothetical protein